MTCHAPFTGVKGSQPSLTPLLHLPNHGDYRLTRTESNQSTGLACRPDEKIFVRVCVIAHGTCHVQLIGLQQAPSSFLSSGASPTFIRPDRTSGSGSGGENAWTYTETSAGLLFSSDPPEETFEHKAFKAKVLKPPYSTSLNWGI